MAELRRDTAGLQRLAYVLDDVFRVPGTNLRFGVDALIGLLPGGGDVAGALLSAYPLLVAGRVGAPPSVIMQMGFNVLVDAAVGAVPVLGDLFDAGWKANRRNVALLQRYVDAPAPVRRSSRLLVAALLLVLFLVVIGAAFIAIKLLGWVIGQF